MQTSYPNESLRIVIADDHSIFRHGLVTFINELSFCKVEGQAGDGKELIKVVEKTKPNIVITDIQMPKMNGYHATSYITQHFPDIGIIGISIFENEYSILKMLQAGAKGYLLKTADKSEITKAILRVSQNETYIASDILHKLSGMYRNTMTRNTGKIPELTAKELEVIRLICKQYLTKEIASMLNTSMRSIESAKERIQNKIGVRNLAGIIIFAFQTGLVTVNEC